ncbi:MAG: CHAD domain-containing protein [Gemmatimonadota bacterium]
MSYRFRRRERLGTGLRRALREQIDRATRSIEDAAQDPGATVHEVRKAVKRIRAGLRLARSCLGEPCFEEENRLYRDADHLLGGAREADVALETLEVVVSRLDGGVDPEVLEQARGRLRERGRGSIQAIVASDGPLAQAGARLREGRQRISHLPTSHLEPRDLAQGLGWSFQRGRQHRDEAYRTGQAADFHAWRRRTKDLWHQLELIRPAWPPVLQARAAEHHRLADLLGLANDAVDLDVRLDRDPELVRDAGTRDALRAECRALRDETWSVARPLGLRLYAESPRTFERLMRVYLEDTFPSA